MSIGFNLKFTSTLASNQKHQPVLWCCEVRRCIYFSSDESPRWHLLPVEDCEFPGVVLVVSFKKFYFLFTAWTIISCKRPGFQPVSAFHMPSSWSLTLSSFWFKVRVVPLFLSQHRKVILGLLIGLISISWFLRECWGLRRWREMKEQTVSGVIGTIRTHIFVD